MRTFASSTFGHPTSRIQLRRGISQLAGAYVGMFNNFSKTNKSVRFVALLPITAKRRKETVPDANPWAVRLYRFQLQRRMLRGILA